MPKKINWIGKKFGKLTILEKDKEQSIKTTVFKCQCECGNICFVRRNNLQSGNTTSCGCTKKEIAVTNGKNAITDLTGKRFGRLIVLGDSQKRYNKKVVWKCLCDCGEKTLAVVSDLTKGSVQSCGCMLQEARSRTASRMIEKLKEKEYKEGTILCVLTGKLRNDNKSGCKGVCWSARLQKWRVYIGFQGKTRNIGTYDKLEDAMKARKEAEEKYHIPILEKYERIK